MSLAQHPSQGASAFGRNYAVLNLDLMAVLIDAIQDVPEGQEFISNCSRWSEAVHRKDPRPLNIFTTLFFHSGEPELLKSAPFGRALRGFGSFAAGSAGVQISHKFAVDQSDVVLQKTRYYAGSGNSLEQILRSRSIDTSGLSLSGVVMSTVYRLFDLDYNIYVISDNVLELPPQNHPEYSKVLLDSLLPKMNVKVISIEEALKELERA